MSEPTKIGYIFLDFNPDVVPPEDAERYREAARISAANHIQGLIDARSEVMGIEAADPAMRLAVTTEINDELIRTIADREERKGNG